MLLNEGHRSKRTGLGNPCSDKERDLIKVAFRKAATGGKVVHFSSRQVRSCNYLCEDYDSSVCYLAHPKCAGYRKDDEVDHHNEPDYPGRMELEKFGSDHIMFEDICDMSLSSIEEMAKCNNEKVAIENTIRDYLSTHLSDRCLRLVKQKTDLKCFRL